MGQRERLYDRLETGVPKRKPGRQSEYEAERYRRQLDQFVRTILQLQSTFDFAPSARGWAYMLEGKGQITKGEFKAAEDLINDCRKSGLLPMDICAEDERRQADGLERLDGGVEHEIQVWDRTLRHAPDDYTPLSFWDDQTFYLEMLVEKVDLKNLFAPVCEEFHIGITNIGGWADLNSRAAMMRRFEEHEDAGHTPVALICCDHDIGGLQISDKLRKNLQDMSRAVGWEPDNLIIDRFGLNFADIERLGLTWIENLETGSGKDLSDPRHIRHNDVNVQAYINTYGVRKCEANALIIKPDEGRQLCRDAILRYLDADAPAHYEERLKPRRDELRKSLAARFRL